MMFSSIFSIAEECFKNVRWVSNFVGDLIWFHPIIMEVKRCALSHTTGLLESSCASLGRRKVTLSSVSHNGKWCAFVLLLPPNAPALLLLYCISFSISIFGVAPLFKKVIHYQSTQIFHLFWSIRNLEAISTMPTIEVSRLVVHCTCHTS